MDVTHPDLLIFGASCEILPIRAETDTANVEVTVLINSFILKRSNILASSHVENLGRAIAASRQILAIAAESDTADDAVMDEMMNEIHIEHPLDLGVENRIPISTLLFLRSGQIIQIPIGKHVTRSFANESLTRRSWASDLRGGSGICVRELVGLLGSCRSRRGAHPSFTWTRGCGWRRWTITCATETKRGVSCQRTSQIPCSTYRSQQHQADILQRSSAVAAALQVGPREQAVEGYAGEAADPGEGEGQDRDHYLLGSL